MRDIAIFGAGGFGKEVACLINIINNKSSHVKYNLVGFFEDNGVVGRKVSRYGTVLGGMNELNAWPTSLAVVIAIGNPDLIRYVRYRITNPEIIFPNIIHPDFTVVDKDTFQIGEGNIIQANCTVSCDTTIGSFNVLNGSIVLGHDAHVGDFNVLMPAIRVSGNVNIGNSNLIGVGSIILQQIKIGHGVRIGAGSVVLTHPKDGGTYLGNPAKLFKY